VPHWKNESPETARRGVRCSDTLHRAFYPWTLPFTVSPGSIPVAVTSGANSTRHYGFHIGIILAALRAMTVVAISGLFCYGLADQLARVIGKTGWQDWNDRGRETFVVSAGLHLCSDDTERNKRGWSRPYTFSLLRS